MENKDKKVLELTSKYLIHRGCQFAEIEVDYYNNTPYRGGSEFRCGSEWGFSSLPFNISNTIKNILTEHDSEIYEEMDFGDSNGYISQIVIRIYPNERKFKCWGAYQTTVVGDEESGSVEIPDNILQRFIENDINNARVDFNGGGDSGYVEDTIYMDDINESINNIDDAQQSVYTFLERCLDNYGDWYNNEGASGSLYINTEDKHVTWSVFPNEYEDVEELLFEVDF